jgi:hypothetical protein
MHSNPLGPLLNLVMTKLPTSLLEVLAEVVPKLLVLC